MATANDDNKPDSEQKESKYKPLKTGYFKLDLQNGWLDFISRYDFDLYATFTFRDEIKPWKAEKRFQKWLGSLNCTLFGWRYSRKGLGIRYAVAYEYQKRGTLHFHALLGAKGLKELDKEYMDKLWKCNGQRDKKGILVNRIINGRALIDNYDPTRRAKQYLTKCIFKGGEIDIYVPRKDERASACSIETAE